MKRTLEVVGLEALDAADAAAANGGHINFSFAHALWHAMQDIKKLKKPQREPLRPIRGPF